MTIDPRQAAFALKSMTYFEICPIHGLAEFSTGSGRCNSCFGEALNLDPAIAALNAGKQFYDGECEIHGLVQFSARGKRCTHCFTRSGAERKSSARALARRASRVEYPADCTACKCETPHSTYTGKCLRCFTTAGMPRRQARRTSIPVERGVDVPAPPVRYAWPFLTMEIGECCAVPALLVGLAKGAMNHARKKGRAFRRATQADGSVRFWRVA